MPFPLPPPSPPLSPSQQANVQGNLGNIPKGASTDINALFGALLDFNWKGVSFPALEFSVVLRQDLAIQKFVDRDGAYIEGTGRAPLEITAMIPFYNGLAKGPNEQWTSPLYPDAWRAFFSASTDKASGTLQHPELGPLTCKLANARTVWRGERRSGVIVEAVWLETDDTNIELTARLADKSPLASLTSWAADLDSSEGTPAVPSVPQLPTFPATFSSFMAGIRGAVDSVTMFQRSFAGKIDSITMQANALSTSIQNMQSSNAAIANSAQNLTNTFKSTPNVSLYWPTLRACEGVKEAARNVNATLNTTNRKPVSVYITKRDGTLATLASTIPANLGDLMTLNRQLVALPVVPSNTSVRYYPLATT